MLQSASDDLFKQHATQYNLEKELEGLTQI